MCHDDDSAFDNAARTKPVGGTPPSMVYAACSAWTLCHHPEGLLNFDVMICETYCEAIPELTKALY